jgi:hypothetical protein
VSELGKSNEALEALAAVAAVATIAGFIIQATSSHALTAAKE